MSIRMGVPVEVSADADVVEVAADAQCDVAVADAVAADAGVGWWVPVGVALGRVW